MGWTALEDKDGRRIGTVGDPVWDIMSDAVENIAGVYKRMFGRLPTRNELEAILGFVIIDGENTLEVPDNNYENIHSFVPWSHCGKKNGADQVYCPVCGAHWMNCLEGD